MAVNASPVCSPVVVIMKLMQSKRESSDFVVKVKKCTTSVIPRHGPPPPGPCRGMWRLGFVMTASSFLMMLEWESVIPWLAVFVLLPHRVRLHTWRRLCERVQEGEGREGALLLQWIWYVSHVRQRRTGFQCWSSLSHTHKITLTC